MTLLTRTRPDTRLQLVKPLANLWLRFCSLVLDQALLLGGAFVLAQILAGLLSLIGVTYDAALPAWLTIGLYGVGAIVDYLVLPLRKRGQTVGKQLVGIRMAGTDDGQVTAAAVITRHLFAYALLGLPLVVGVVLGNLLLGIAVSGLLFALVAFFMSLDERKQGWHDKLGGTTVIADPRRTSANLYPAIVSSLFIHVLVALAVLVLIIVIPLLLQALNIKFPDLTPPEPPTPPQEILFIDPNDKNPKPPKDAPKATANSEASRRNPRKPTNTGVKGAPARRQQAAAPQPKPVARPEPRPEPEPAPKPRPAPKPKAAPPPSRDPILPKAAELPKETSPELAPLEPEPAPEAPPAPPAPRRRASRSSNTSGSALGASSLGPPLTASRGGGNGGIGESGELNPGRDGGGSGIDAAQDIDWGPYMAALQRKVKRYWIAPEAGNSRRTVLVFSVTRGGQAVNLRVARSSGSASTDQAAIEAVQRAQPFSRLPAGYKGDRIDIQFTFDINVFGVGGGDYSPRGF